MEEGFMGYVLTKAGFAEVVRTLLEDYRIFAPVRKTGAGRFTDVDAVIYDEIRSADEIELEAKSDYAPKEFLTPLSETLFYFLYYSFADISVSLGELKIVEELQSFVYGKLAEL